MGYICLKFLLIIIIIIVIIIINIIIIIMIIIIIIIIIIIKPNFKQAIQCKHVTRAYKNSCTAGPLPRDIVIMTRNVTLKQYIGRLNSKTEQNCNPGLALKGALQEPGPDLSFNSFVCPFCYYYYIFIFPLG